MSFVFATCAGINWLAAHALSAAPSETNSSSLRPVTPGQSAQVNSQTSASRVDLARGRQLAASGWDDLAQTQFRRATIAAPHWLEARQVLARSLSRSGRWIEASQAWREVLRLLHEKSKSAAPLSDAESTALSKNRREAEREFKAARGHLSAFWRTRDVVSLGANSDNSASGRRGPHLMIQAEIKPSAHLPVTPSRAVLKKAPIGFAEEARKVFEAAGLSSRQRFGAVAEAMDQALAPRGKVLYTAFFAPPKPSRVSVLELSRALEEVRHRQWMQQLEIEWASHKIVTLSANSDNALIGRDHQSKSVIVPSPSEAAAFTSPKTPSSSPVGFRTSALLQPAPLKSKEAREEREPDATSEWQFSFFLPSLESSPAASARRATQRLRK